MIFHFLPRFPQLKPYWDKYLPFQQRRELPAHSILLQEGKRSTSYLFIEKGCVRTWFNAAGVEKTVQFLFENEGLSSIDSFINNVPSPVTIETIEPSIIYVLPKKHVLQLLDDLSHQSDFLPMVLKMFAQRQTHYMNEFVSMIRDTPEQRYLRLLKERPHIIRRVPQHYIASYLGISKVHLSRIKTKLAKGKDRF